MKRIAVILLSACIMFVVSGGCAKKHIAAEKDASLPQPIKLEETRSEPEFSLTTSGKIQDAIIAVVNNEIITLYEVNREARSVIIENEKSAPLSDADKSRIRSLALDSLIEKKLLDQKVKELNIIVDNSEINQAIEDIQKQNGINQEELIRALADQGMSYDAYRSQLKEQLEKLRLVSMEVRSKIQVGETEMLDYYNANLQTYREDDTFRARHIFFKTSDKDSPDEIKQTTANALEALSEAKSGKDFIELAKTYSEDPAALTDGGDLGSFKKGDMQPELERNILSLKPGEISELVRSPVGLHIIKLESHSYGKSKPFETVKSEIEDALYRQKSEDRFKRWAKELRDKANIELKDLPVGVL